MQGSFSPNLKATWRAPSSSRGCNYYVILNAAERGWVEKTPTGTSRHAKFLWEYFEGRKQRLKVYNIKWEKISRMENEFPFCRLKSCGWHRELGKPRLALGARPLSAELGDQKDLCHWELRSCRYRPMRQGLCHRPFFLALGLSPPLRWNLTNLSVWGWPLYVHHRNGISGTINPREFPLGPDSRSTWPCP